MLVTQEQKFHAHQHSTNRCDGQCVGLQKQKLNYTVHRCATRKRNLGADLITLSWKGADKVQCPLLRPKCSDPSDFCRVCSPANVAEKKRGLTHSLLPYCLTCTFTIEVPGAGLCLMLQENLQLHTCYCH